MDEPLEVVPATASLYQEALAKQIATRQAARRAVLNLQDSRSLKLALAARPRVHSPIAPGQYVAHWRSQKWVHGALDSQGRWYGPAVVLGNVGRNYVIIHKKQIFRCAPEQIRPSTQSELLPESYPPGFGESDAPAPVTGSNQPVEAGPALSAPQPVLERQQQPLADQVMETSDVAADKSLESPTDIFDNVPEAPTGDGATTESSSARPAPVTALCEKCFENREHQLCSVQDAWPKVISRK